MIYFDNAATTIRKPDCVVQAVTEAMCSLGNAGRGVHSGALSASRILYEARVALSELFGAENPHIRLRSFVSRTDHSSSNSNSMSPCSGRGPKELCAVCLGGWAAHSPGQEPRLYHMSASSA